MLTLVHSKSLIRFLFSSINFYFLGHQYCIRYSEWWKTWYYLDIIIKIIDRIKLYVKTEYILYLCILGLIASFVVGESIIKSLSITPFFVTNILLCKEPIFSMHAALPLFGVIRYFFVIKISHNVVKTQWWDHWGVRVTTGSR